MTQFNTVWFFFAFLCLKEESQKALVMGA
jgi:hypothetical protein